jgi:mannose-6-phosphate isomerase-like protein (cupin superfamily)
MKLEKLLGPAEMKDKCGLFARVTLHPGDVLGFHEHHGNGECYFILSGEGEYDDNGVKRVVKAGDVTWTPDGAGHGLSNAAGKEDIVFIALIINS